MSCLNTVNWHILLEHHLRGKRPGPARGCSRAGSMPPGTGPGGRPAAAAGGAAGPLVLPLLLAPSAAYTAVLLDYPSAGDPPTLIARCVDPRPRPSQHEGRRRLNTAPLGPKQHHHLEPDPQRRRGRALALCV